jgi:hypothetical protein
MKFKNFNAVSVHVWTPAGHSFVIGSGEIKEAPEHFTQACLEKGLVPEGAYNEGVDDYDTDLVVNLSDEPVSESSDLEKQAIKRSEAAAKGQATKAANAAKAASAQKNLE